MRKVITEQDFDDQGRLMKETVTMDGEIVRTSTFSYGGEELISIHPSTSLRVVE